MGFFSYYDDEVWVIVKRTINNATKRFVEYFKTDIFDEDEDAYFVDCGLSTDSPKTITAITKANPGVVTAGTHGFSNGDIVIIRGVVGMTEVNQIKFKVANKADNTFELTNPTTSANINTSAYTTYVSGGEVRKCNTTGFTLAHLIAETISVLGDGIVLDDEVVGGAGAVTISSASGQVHIGLPFTSQVKTMRLEVQGSLGTTQGRKKHAAEIILRLYKSLGGEVGNADTQKDIDYEADFTTSKVALFTGDKTVIMPSKWDSEGYILVKQTEPLPLNILCLIPNFAVNE